MLYNILLIPTLLLLFIFNPFRNSQQPGNTVIIKDKTFKVDIANTEYKRSKGLMFRESLKENAGMLFIFSKEGTPSFYNKNVNFPLTFIWINKDYEIVDVSELPMDTFQTTRSSKPIKYVLEINKGVFSNPEELIGESVMINQISTPK